MPGTVPVKFCATEAFRTRLFDSGRYKSRPAPAPGHYRILPALTTIFWTATLLGLLLWWTVSNNATQYKIDEMTVVFISDVGAAHKAVFIPGTALTWIFYSASLFTERWLRHLRRIPGSMRKPNTASSCVACVFGFCGGFALMLLSIIDAFNHSTAHWILTADTSERATSPLA